MEHNTNGGNKLKFRSESLIIAIGAAFYNSNPWMRYSSGALAEIAVCVPPHNKTRKTDPCSGKNISGGC
jgi:hypothetical protein